MMNRKDIILHDLNAEFTRWQDLLHQYSESDLITPLPGESLSIKDKVAHLHAWQQLSIARLEAALQKHAPVKPIWLQSGDPDTGDVDPENERIYQMFRDLAWQDVFHMWRSGFERFIELFETVPEEDLFTEGKFSWLPGYALADVMDGSLEHHREHFVDLTGTK